MEAKDGFWYVLGVSLRLTPWLCSQKLENFDPAKGLAPIQTGDPPKMASEWLAKQGRDSEFPYIQSFMALSQNPDLRDSCLMSFSCLPISWPLCLSPSDFLDQSFWTYHIRMLSRKGFGGSLWSRSLSYIQKPEGSKALLTS